MVEHRDVIIVGAGLSGIGAACHLHRNFPGKSVTILEGRAAMGGTWDLFRYPGVRSDSDMFTLGYSFRPWTEPDAIADGPNILRYIKDTAREFGIARDIRLNHQVSAAAWDSETAQWTVTARRTDVGKDVTLTTGLMMLSGVPNLVWTLGYTNASWTLKADLIARYVCRLINYMEQNQCSSVTPMPPANDELAPLIDLTSGYVQRGIDVFPKQGTVVPWRQQQNYFRDMRLLTRGPLDDHVVFASGSRTVPRPTVRQYRGRGYAADE